MRSVLMIWIGIFPFCLMGQGLTQEEASNFQVDSNVQYILDDRMTDLYNMFLEENQQNPVIDGYRIQLASGANRNNINDIKAKFYAKFPEDRPYIIYQQPNFKLRVGNYRTKLDAARMLLEVKKHFADAFIIRDELKSEDL